MRRIGATSHNLSQGTQGDVTRCRRKVPEPCSGLCTSAASSSMDGDMPLQPSYALLTPPKAVASARPGTGFNDATIPLRDSFTDRDVMSGATYRSSGLTRTTGTIEAPVLTGSKWRFRSRTGRIHPLLLPSLPVKQANDILPESLGTSRCPDDDEVAAYRVWRRDRDNRPRTRSVHSRLSHQPRVTPDFTYTAYGCRSCTEATPTPSRYQ